MVLLRFTVVLSIALAGSLPAAFAHDPSAWGGTFRSRDGGVTWLPVDAGLFIGGAVSLSVNPVDPNHLLYASDTRLLRSRNGGRDWVHEQAPVFSGPTLAVAFDGSGKTALAASAAGIFRSEDNGSWTAVDLPGSANPALFIVAGTTDGRFYVAGARGIYRSDDHARSWIRLAEHLPEDLTLTSLAVMPQPTETIIAVVQGSVHVSSDLGRTWREHQSGLPSGSIETVAADPAAGRVWAAGGDQLYRSDNLAQPWRLQGQPLPQAGTKVRGIAASKDGMAILLTTHRGLFRSTDGGTTWGLMEGSLPVHLEAGPLVRDPRHTDTLYAGFSLTPYNEIRRRAVEGSNLLSQVDPLSLAGGAAFLILIAVAAAYAVRKLLRLSQTERPPATTGTH